MVRFRFTTVQHEAVQRLLERVQRDIDAVNPMLIATKALHRSMAQTPDVAVSWLGAYLDGDPRTAPPPAGEVGLTVQIVTGALVERISQHDWHSKRSLTELTQSFVADHEQVLGPLPEAVYGWYGLPRLAVAASPGPDRDEILDLMTILLPKLSARRVPAWLGDLLVRDEVTNPAPWMNLGDLVHQDPGFSPRLYSKRRNLFDEAG